MKIHLSRHSWHRKLQNYVLSIETHSDQDFPNLCPYFWLTIFCMFAVPFVFIWKVPVTYSMKGVLLAIVGVCRGIELLIKAIAYPVKTYICIPLDEHFVQTTVKEMTPLQVLKAYGGGTKRDEALFQRWSESTTNWYEKIQEYREIVTRQFAEEKAAKQAAFRAREESERAARRARERRLMRIANGTKKVAPFVLVAVSLPFIYWGFLLIMLIGGALINADWGWWLNGLWAVIKWTTFVMGVGAVTLAIIYFLVGLARKIFSKCSILLAVPQARRKKEWRPPSAFTRKVLIPFVETVFAIIEGIADGFRLLGQYIKSTKDGYCPKIDWEE
jgi:hypothetical protein